MGVVAKHSSMIFYSNGNDHNSQRVRLVLAEKGVAVDIVDVDPRNIPEDLVDLNPYHTLPTLVDRDLVLYESQVIMEYLDERFPHPPLLPVYPVARAQSRLFIFRIEKDWCDFVDTIVEGKAKDTVIDKARKDLRESLVSIAPIFADKPFFMSEEFTLVDCCVAPILWRLPQMGIELPPKHGKPILDYMDRIFERESFQASLSEAELDMRD
ncbi:MAG: glutathione S-transferase N-terminal domain-containing protein [bacterium]|nr:stringent starvation protein A [Gammaproteobacteria bacterium]HIL94978.1 stringent starvation protein A [Pseudomonadales bacterium]